MMPLQSQVSLSQDVLLQEVDDEAVLLDLSSEQYFGLNEVGVQLWRALEADGNLEVAHQKLLALYEVEADRLAEDLLTLVGDLERAGLVRVQAS